jgi:hypothetical protein
VAGYAEYAEYAGYAVFVVAIRERHKETKAGLLVEVPCMYLACTLHVTWMRPGTAGFSLVLFLCRGWRLPSRRLIVIQITS